MLNAQMHNALTKIELDTKAKASVNYVKGRYAIDSVAAEVAKSNAARAKTLANFHKEALASALQGQRDDKNPRLIRFFDGSTAKF